MSNQAIIRKVTIIAATCTGKPSPETIKALKATGAEFKNGQWIHRTSPDGVIVDEKDAAKVFAV